MELKKCTCRYIPNPICPFGLKTRIDHPECPTHSDEVLAKRNQTAGKPQKHSAEPLKAA